MFTSGSWGKAIYSTPQACKAFSYSYDKDTKETDTKETSQFLLVCEVALGVEEKRMKATTKDRNLNWENLQALGDYRSVVHHAGVVYNHEERMVYRNTQIKP